MRITLQDPNVQVTIETSTTKTRHRVTITSMSRNPNRQQKYTSTRVTELSVSTQYSALRLVQTKVQRLTAAGMEITTVCN